MLFGHYKNGFLEQAGGMLDQSRRYLTAMSIIGRIHGEWERAKVKHG